MPPRKKAASAAAADADAPAAEDDAPRRSSRIKDQPKPASPKKRGPAKPRVKKDKAPADEPAADDAAPATAGDAPAEDGETGKKRTAAADAEEPAPKKAKAGSVKPASKAGSKPPSKAKADDKENDAAVPETIAEEPEEAGAAKLAIGDAIPAVTLHNEMDNPVDVAALTADAGLVLFLFPKADTPGCTKQACAYRDNFDKFKEKGYAVYGLSTDLPPAATKWQTKNNLPYSFLSDPKRELITALGAASGKSAKRSHFVFGKGGKLLGMKMPVKPEESFTLALETINSQP